MCGRVDTFQRLVLRSESNSSSCKVLISYGCNSKLPIQPGGQNTAVTGNVVFDLATKIKQAACFGSSLGCPLGKPCMHKASATKR